MQLFKRKDEEFDRENTCFACRSKKPLIEGHYYRALMFDQYQNITDDPTNTNSSYAVVEFRIHEDCMANNKYIGTLASLVMLQRNLLIVKPGEQPAFHIAFDGKDLIPQQL